MKKILLKNRESLIFIIIIGIYYYTSSKTIFIWDSLDLTLSSYFLGIPHPTGYPLYCVLGYINSWIFPSYNIAFLYNFFSSIFSILSLIIYYKFLKYLNFKKNIALYTILIFGFSSEFWNISTVAEVYSMLIFFIILNLYLAIKYIDNRTNKNLFILIFFFWEFNM